MIYRPKEVVNEVCICAGAVAAKNQFSYVVDAGKWGSAHESSNMITALIKYGNVEHRVRHMTAADLEYATKHVDASLMRLFQYQIPSSRAGSGQ